MRKELRLCTQRFALPANSDPIITRGNYSVFVQGVEEEAELRFSTGGSEITSIRSSRIWPVGPNTPNVLEVFGATPNTSND